MRIARVSAERLVIEVENVSTMRFLFMPILHPGQIQSITFLDRESDNVALLQHRAHWKGRQPAARGERVVRGQPGRRVLSPSGRNSHRPGAARVAMRRGARSIH
jgi:hypothetical protein